MIPTAFEYQRAASLEDTLTRQAAVSNGVRRWPRTAVRAERPRVY